MGRWRQALGRSPWWRPAGRIRGEPASANGASSFHLSWVMEGGERLAEVSAVLEVLGEPPVDRLYFWALQVSFLGAGPGHAAAHLGLQWNAGHPRRRAVNWGGYGSDGRLLDGSPSPLPSAPGDPNTRDYPWEPLRRYRLRVSPSPSGAGWWRGEVTDLATGEATVVRDLAGGGEALGGPMVWSEVFARCEHPSVAVRWSGLEAVDAAGATCRPAAVRVNYQARAHGGCDNTTVRADEAGLVQVTNAPRAVPQGALVSLP